jgi:hypothetical protein
MTWVMRKTLTIALTIVMINRADAHCYSRWYYPYPQNCGVAYRSHSHRMALLQSNSIVTHSITYDIPLPDLNGTWINETETPEQLELMEGMERVKALRSLSSN